MISDTRYLYDEIHHAGVDFSDEREVEAYDSYMQKLRNISNEVGRILESARVGREDVVLDIGTGTGEIPIGLSANCKRVVAIDISAAMIKFAEQKARKQGISTIEFHQAGFLTFQFNKENFDVVVSQMALHHLPDFWKYIALKRIHDVLKPEGRFFFQDAVLPGTVENYDHYFHDVVSKIEAAGGAKVARDAEKSFRDEYVTLDWAMENLLTKSGFDIIHHEYGAPFIGTFLCKKAVMT
ncbi:MAG: class I SAM-dependent methyltransferase [Negativicutes bacterium]